MSVHAIWESEKGQSLARDETESVRMFEDLLLSRCLAFSLKNMLDFVCVCAGLWVLV